MTSPSHPNVEDTEVIAKYLAGQLADRERGEFEKRLLEDRELLRELDRTAQFKAGLQGLRDSGALGRLLRALPWWQRGSTFALAASLLLVVVGAGVWFKMTVTPRPILAASIQALGVANSFPMASSFSVQRTRSSSYDVTFNSNAGAIELRVKPETMASPSRYRVSVGQYSNSPFQPIATVSDLKPAADGFVPLYLDSSQLTPAIYELRISGDKGTSTENAESSFLIEVAAALPVQDRK